MPMNPDPLVMSRTFAAPRETVFKAFSTAEHVKQWFSPEGLTTPEAEVDFRPGGVFAVCMRMPDGLEHWSRGTFETVSPYDRIVFVSKMGDPDNPGFTAHTAVTFEDAECGTKLTVRQAYTILDEAMLAAVQGAPEGWRTTLNKLERLVARMGAEASGAIVHDTFRLERTYDAPLARVWAAIATVEGKSKWFTGTEDWTLIERTMDFRVGGRERLKGRWSGVTSTFDATYFDIVPHQRLVYAYDMWTGERKLSVSLASMEVEAVEGGTRLVITEQGAFFHGDDAASRERGTAFLLDRIGASLAG